MSKGYNHYNNCPCKWCNSFGRNYHIEETIYLENIYETRRKLNNAFSFTIPNAKCPSCKAEVFYYENTYGSKVFFEKLGTPWPKHNCFYTDELMPELNADNFSLHNSYSINYYPIKPTIIYQLSENYLVIEFVNKDIQKTKYVVKYNNHDLGICFIEKTPEGEYLNGHNGKEYKIECYKLQEAKQKFQHLFPYTIGKEIEIEIDVANDIGVRTEIFINKKITLNENKIFRAYIYNAEIKNVTKRILKNDFKVRILATSHLNNENEIIFSEL